MRFLPILPITLAAAVAACAPAAPAAQGDGAVAAVAHRTMQDAIVGRWDLTLQTTDGPRPSWLEVRRSGHAALVGQFVGIVGSARPIARVDVSGSGVRFAIPPQWEEGSGDLALDGRLDGERLVGIITVPNGSRNEFTAARAPLLRRATEPQWGEPVTLFNGRDLSGWRVIAGENTWTVGEGLLRNAGSGGNIVTDRTFGDFKLHVEFRYPKGSNSGVYLRGRYEVQIQDSLTRQPAPDLLGAVYGFLAPSVVAARQAGEWQSFDITLVGRMITVIANGTPVIVNREIPGITGGALDSDEGAAGPILLQGDHGPIEFRNIVLTPAR